MGDKVMIVLASASPRRRVLLGQLGFEFILRPQDIDESPKLGERASQLVLRLSREKAEAALKNSKEGYPILGADTIVVLGDEVLGKPSNRQEGFEILSKLSGQEHIVETAVSVIFREKLNQCHVKTKVRFRKLSYLEIERYLETKEPYDKAGAYGIQGEGAALIDEIHGSYTNVVGLPVDETMRLLRNSGALMCKE